jgi:hypothetical protein
MLSFLLLLAGFVCFLLAALGVPVQRVNLVAAGLACWVLTQVIAVWPS